MAMPLPPPLLVARPLVDEFFFVASLNNTYKLQKNPVNTIFY